MKDTTKEIQNIINDKELTEKFRRIKDENSGTSYYERTIEESFKIFILIKKQINGNIDNGFIDDLTQEKRNDIKSHLENLVKHIKSSDISYIIYYVDVIYDRIINLGFIYNLLGKNKYYEEIKHISEIKQKIEDISSLLKKKINQVDLFDEIKNEVYVNNDHIKNILVEIKNNNEETNDILKISKKYKEELEEIYSDIEEISKNCETKEKEIENFSKNTEKYKLEIENLVKNANYVLEKREEIGDLIKEAEDALHIKSAQGISAAFNAKCEEEIKYNNWLWGAVTFLAIAFFITSWIVTGWWIEKNNDLNSIIGRIVAIIISISAATFCANQYNKLKNIKEDYAYKAVLAKSIVAFTNKIKEEDPNKVPDYLDKILSEIHKDPLRKDAKNEKGLSIIDIKELLDKALDKIPNIK